MSSGPAPSQDGKGLAYLLLVLTTLFWSGNFVLARAMHDSLPPVALSFWRWMLAGTVLAPFAWRRMLAALPLLKTHWRTVLPLALFGVAGYNTLAYQGLQSTPATNAGLLNAFIPILILLLGALFFGQHLGRIAIAGILVSLLGVLMLVGHGEPSRLAQFRFNPGDLWVLAAGLSWACYTLLLRRLPAGLNRMALLMATIVLGVMVLCPAYLLESLSGRTLTVTVPHLLAILYVGLLPSVMAYLFYNHGVAKLGAARAGQFIHLMPVFVPLLSTLFLGEQLHLFHAAGIALIFAGIAVSSRG